MTKYYIFKALNNNICGSLADGLTEITPHDGLRVEVFLGGTTQIIPLPLPSNKESTWNTSIPVRTIGKPTPQVCIDVPCNYEDTHPVHGLSMFDLNDLETSAQHSIAFTFKLRGSGGSESYNTICLQPRLSDSNKNVELALKLLLYDALGPDTTVKAVEELIDEELAKLKRCFLLAEAFKEIHLPALHGHIGHISLNHLENNEYIGRMLALILALYSTASNHIGNSLGYHIGNLCNLHVYYLFAYAAPYIDQHMKFRPWAINALFDLTILARELVWKHYHKEKRFSEVKLINSDRLSYFISKVLELAHTLGSGEMNTPNSEHWSGEVENPLFEEMYPYSNPDHNKNIRSGQRLCSENTCIDVLDRINEWAQNTDLPNICWLVGGIRAGKTTIALTVAEEYQRKNQLGCFFKYGREGGSYNIISTIANHLSSTDDNVRKAMRESSERANRLSTIPDPFELFLQNPLQKVKGLIKKPVLIVIDSMDAGDTDIRFHDVLKDRLRKLPPNFRFLITTRPTYSSEPHIDETSEPPGETIINLDYRSDERKKDVCKFINYQFGLMREKGLLVVPEDWRWDDGMKILEEAADGFFIWASAAVEFVEGDDNERFDRLDRLVKDTHILDLSPLYKATINKYIYNDYLETKDRNMIIFIFFAASHMSSSTISEIDSILGLHKTPWATKNIFVRFGLLVEYQRDPDRPIEARAHPSFYRYLQSNLCTEDIGERGYSFATLPKADIALGCFNVIENCFERNFDRLSPRPWTNTRDPRLEYTIKEESTICLRYACYNWVSHLQDAPYSKELRDAICVFAKNHLEYWLEVLIVMKQCDNRSKTALSGAIAWLGDNDSELSDVLKYACNHAQIYTAHMSGNHSEVQLPEADG